jgi:hypothetical protein
MVIPENNFPADRLSTSTTWIVVRKLGCAQNWFNLFTTSALDSLIMLILQTPPS